MGNPVVDNVRRSLGRPSEGLSGRRSIIYPVRQPGSTEAEIDRFFNELRNLQGIGERLRPSAIAGSLQNLVEAQRVKKASLWQTDFLTRLNVSGLLQDLGVQLVRPTADKYEMAQCDLGITEADFLLPETGTVGLRSSAAKPRAVSLLPSTHLVIASPEALRADLQQVFAEAKQDHYLVFISGPSRTGDIELVATLGVHGPRNLYVWLIQE